MTPSWYLVVLALVMGAGFGWVLCALFAAYTETDARRGYADPTGVGR